MTMKSELAGEVQRGMNLDEKSIKLLHNVPSSFAEFKDMINALARERSVITFCPSS